jgi:hypothetical protein
MNLQVLRCPRCGAAQPSQSRCQVCGAELSEASRPPAASAADAGRVDGSAGTVGGADILTGADIVHLAAILFLFLAGIVVAGVLVMWLALAML